MWKAPEKSERKLKHKHNKMQSYVQKRNFFQNIKLCPEIDLNKVLTTVDINSLINDINIEIYKLDYDQLVLYIANHLNIDVIKY